MFIYNKVNELKQIVCTIYVYRIMIYEYMIFMIYVYRFIDIYICI